MWTASYGGQRAVIIKANGTGTVNYTVLDVTEANEKREVDAYIAAYAKGGEKVGYVPDADEGTQQSLRALPRGLSSCGRGGKAAPASRYATHDDRRASSSRRQVST